MALLLTLLETSNGQLKADSGPQHTTRDLDTGDIGQHDLEPVQEANA